MSARLGWLQGTEIALFVVISLGAVALTMWQTCIDRSVFERYFGALNPVGVITGASMVGVIAIVWLQQHSAFRMVGPGSASGAVTIIAWVVPVMVVVAIVADFVLRFAKDANVALPDALRFYPAIAVFVEIVLHAVPVAVLVAVLGSPAGLDATFWRIAVPVALLEAILQAAYATSIGTAVFSAAHLTVFGLVQVWLFWRFGFVWMLGFRLAYYSLWHVAWAAARLELLF